MPRNYGPRQQNLLARYDALMDPDRQYLPMVLQMRVRDGERAGALTRKYGGVWDRDANRGAGEYAGYYDAWGRWTGDYPEPVKVAVRDVSEQQLPYIQDFDHRVVLAEGARRSGKSAALGPKVIICCLYFPHCKGVLMSPTFRQGWNPWDHIRRFMPREWLLPGTFGINKTDKRMRLINGAEIILLHAHDDDAARSEGCAWLALDERQDIREGAAANAFLSMSEGGDDFTTFETATIKHELREHHDAVAKAKDGAIYRMTSRGNPFISHRMFDLAEKMLDKATIQRELEAKWPDLVGRIYYPFVADDMVREFPADELEDITAAFCADRYGTPSWGDTQANNLIFVDPPWHAIVCRMVSDPQGRRYLHAIDEVIVGLDAMKGDVKSLAAACKSRHPGGVVVRDPHDMHHGRDCDKYFKNQGYWLRHMSKVNPEYRFTAVRARMEAGRTLFDPRCRHLIECLNLQQYKEGSSKPDKTIKSRITPHFTVDHPGDAYGYGVYKIWPAKYGEWYAENEEAVS